ncbi:precorrin-6y C5,15-methyltransferase (decarboxylating) subunit CbiE [Streptomyces mirabilis]|nr:precorrin-6y C5,15-methyltransferase (decarboxylating) subunit CbiE [Streptomyces mirabilis]
MITVFGTGTGHRFPRTPRTRWPAPGSSWAPDATLRPARLPDAVERIVLGPLAPALDAIEGCLEKERRVVVLASGDPGFFGIVRALAERFGTERLDVRPGVSSVATAFARLGLPWDDAVVVSAHGRALRTAVQVCRSHPKVAVLTGPGSGPAELGAALAHRGAGRVLVVASALGDPAHERVERVTPAQAAGRDWGTAVSVVLCLDESRALAPCGRSPVPGRTRPVGPGRARVQPPRLDDQQVRGASAGAGPARAAPRRTGLGRRRGLRVRRRRVRVSSGPPSPRSRRHGRLRPDPRQRRGARRRRPRGARGRAHRAVRPGRSGRRVHRRRGRELPAIVTVSRAAGPAGRRRRHGRARPGAGGPEALTAAGLDCDGVLLQSSRLAPLPGTSPGLAATNPVFLLWGVQLRRVPKESSSDRPDFRHGGGRGGP